MFPDIHGQQRGSVAGQRRTGVAGRDDGQATVGIFHQPGPACAEIFCRRVGEFGLEIREAAEGFSDSRRQFAFRFATGVWRQAVPVEGVVPDLRGVVEDAAIGRTHDLFQGFAFKRGAFDQVVKVSHIGLVVLTVVVFQGFR